ncbi:MAG: hypothetical protein K2N48_00605 [Muribaculaceae bacterium]|nr:hypothetical protein [Muribaculaceae bacterium]
MDFKIDDVSGSTVSRFSFALMACCIISYQSSLYAHNENMTTGAYVLMAMAGVVLLAWLIWFFYMYLSGKKVIRMPRTPGIVTEAINWVIFILWILSDFVSIARHPLLSIVAWCLFAFSVIYYVVYCRMHNSDN